MHRSPLDKPPTTMMVPFAFQVACFAQLPTGKAHRQPRDTALDGFTPDAYWNTGDNAVAQSLHPVLVMANRARHSPRGMQFGDLTLVHDDAVIAGRYRRRQAGMDLRVLPLEFRVQERLG